MFLPRLSTVLAFHSFLQPKVINSNEFLITGAVTTDHSVVKASWYKKPVPTKKLFGDEPTYHVDDEFAEPVVLKCCKKPKKNIPTLEAYKNEAQMLTTFKEPEFADLIGTIDEDHQYCLILREYTGDVSDYVFHHYPYRNERDWDQAKDVGRQMIKAVKKLHSKNLIHQDIKPANFFYSEDEFGDVKVVLADFEFAVEEKRAPPRKDAHGTIVYASPETLYHNDDQSALTKAADIYSLGVSLYYLLTEKYPYKHVSDVGAIRLLGSDEAVMEKRQELDMVALKEVPNHHLLISLFKNMLHPDPEQRITDLDTILRNPFFLNF